jgi:hypothetical protein
LLVPLLSLLLLVGCGARQANQPVPSTAAAATSSPIPAEPTALSDTMSETVAAPPVDPAAVCPAEREGATLYVSVEHGYCMLYPSGLTLRADTVRPGQVVHLIGSPADPNAIETVVVDLSIAQNGPADGLDSAQYATTWLDLYGQGMQAVGMTPPQEPITLGGQPAVLIDSLPSMYIPQRGVFVVANGVKYQVTLMPRPEDVPELAEEATSAWNMVTQSIVFFPPQADLTVVRPADVCPAETAEGKPLVDLAGGYCLLYPADFAPNPMFPGSIAGGPELGPVEGFDSLRASLTVGSYDLGEQSPEQVLQPASEQIDPTSVMSTTIGGYPAVVFDFTGGPWRQRNATIVAGDSVYTFVAQPWDSELFPQALPDVERVWQTVTESIAFFDKWR